MGKPPSPGDKRRNSIAVNHNGGGKVKRSKKVKRATSMPRLDAIMEEQQTPAKMRDFMDMHNKEKKAKPVKPQPAKVESPSEAAAWKLNFGETPEQMNRRLQQEVTHEIQMCKVMPDREPELEEEREKKKERKREKRRAKEVKKKEKKSRRLSDVLFKKRETEMLTDKVNFGEVVLKPPELKIKPKGAEKATTKKTYKFLEKFATDGKMFKLKK